MLQNVDVDGHQTSFEILFGCPMADFGPLSREQSHSPDANNCVLTVSPEGS